MSALGSELGAHPVVQHAQMIFGEEAARDATNAAPDDIASSSVNPKPSVREVKA